MGIRSVLMLRNVGDDMEEPLQGRNVDVMHKGIQICHEQTTPKRGGENGWPNGGLGINAALL